MRLFLDSARRFREALSMPLVLLGGITDRAAMDTALREGFDYVAMARALLSRQEGAGGPVLIRDRSSSG